MICFLFLITGVFGDINAVDVGDKAVTGENGDVENLLFIYFILFYFAYILF